jgi:hypothetical protein
MKGVTCNEIPIFKSGQTLKGALILPTDLTLISLESPYQVLIWTYLNSKGTAIVNVNSSMPFPEGCVFLKI